MSKKIRRDLYNSDYIGVIEDNADPKRLGRVKVRVECLHGRTDDIQHIETEYLPWLEPSSRGMSFGVSSIGKVVYVSFEDDDYYKGSYFAEEHHDINLQNKLESMTDEEYTSFYANTFNAQYQHYIDLNKGLVMDFKKSNINIDNDSDININLKDNKSKLNLGSEDATQQAMLGNHWIDWMSGLVNILMGAPYVGNMGAPVIPSPNLLTHLNKYYAIKQTFLSDHVMIVDDKKVKPQNRGYDTLQYNDNYNNETVKESKKVLTKLSEPVTRDEGGSNPVNNKQIPANNFIENLISSKKSANVSSLEQIKFLKPFENEIDNGKIPVMYMTVSKYLSKSFPNDERRYLLNDVATSLDKWIDFVYSTKKKEWNDIFITKGYTDFKRQQNTRKQYPINAPIEGEDPFGFGNQIEIYYGVDRNDFEKTQNIKTYLQTKEILTVEAEILDYLINTGKQYNFMLAENTANSNIQWWHWIYLKQ